MTRIFTDIYISAFYTLYMKNEKKNKIPDTLSLIVFYEPFSELHRTISLKKGDMLTCLIILQCIIKIFQMYAEIQARYEL